MRACGRTRLPSLVCHPQPTRQRICAQVAEIAAPPDPLFAPSLSFAESVGMTNIRHLSGLHFGWIPADDWQG